MSLIKHALIAGGLAGILAVAGAAPSSARIVRHGVYGPYGGYAYVPAYRRSWDYPAGYDTSGMPYSYGELGWQPGPRGAAPANPCLPSQRWQNRC